MIGIVDYGVGNLASVRNALDYLGIENILVSTPSQFDQVQRLILPGVGAFGQAMEQLNSTGMAEALKGYADSGRPLLGICLGMQLLLSSSSEMGNHAGLNLVEGTVLRLAENDSSLRVPNIGWCRVRRNGESRLLHGIEDENLCFYFVHSYYCRLKSEIHAVGMLDYGTECHVVFESDNLYGCQFHPEKSQKSGLSLLKNFAGIPCR